MARRFSVVVSQGQSHNPAKRKLEEDIVAGLLLEPGIEVTIITHLYDLRADGTGILALQGIHGDMVVLSWMFPRATHWILDRNGIHGHFGETLLKSADEELEDEDEEAADTSPDDKHRVLQQRTIPHRKIYCLDLRCSDSAELFIDEIRRISRESTTSVVALGNWINGTPRPDQVNRFALPTNDTALDAAGSVLAPAVDGSEPSNPVRLDEEPDRRWYPVIDFSRCTNCMECIDFCLFGVYGVDQAETILVEQPDNCRKGCPACSRVCPENAIIFPQHKSPAIAGGALDLGGLKIDLSKLFGAPDGGASSLEVAARERDEQLVLAGRTAVGMTVGIPKRQTHRASQPQDELDNLLDELDSCEL